MANSKLAPATKESKIIMKKIDFLAPGMAIDFIDDEGKTHWHRVVGKLTKRFENTFTKQKVDLKIKPGPGNIFFHKIASSFPKMLKISAFYLEKQKVLSLKNI